MSFRNEFLDSITAFHKYYQATMAPEEDLTIEEEEFDPRKYNILVNNMLLAGLRFKVQNLRLLKPNEYATYIGLVSDRNSMSEEKMASISEFLPLLYIVTKILHKINEMDAACFMYILDPNR